MWLDIYSKTLGEPNRIELACDYYTKQHDVEWEEGGWIADVLEPVFTFMDEETPAHVGGYFVAGNLLAEIMTKTKRPPREIVSDFERIACLALYDDKVDFTSNRNFQESLRAQPEKYFDIAN